MKGGTSRLRFTVLRFNPVTEFPVQLISGQLQWELEFDDEVQRLRAGGSSQYDFNLSRTDNSLSGRD